MKVNTDGQKLFTSRKSWNNVLGISPLEMSAEHKPTV